MPDICFYFQVHQPYRLKHYTFFDIGENPYYEDVAANKSIMAKVASKCYIPMNKLLLRLINKHKGRFRVSFSISGTALDQFEEYAPEVLETFKALVDTGCVELLAETYNHSLSFIYSESEFREQVKLHTEKIRQLFGVTPRVFRNTELIYNNDLASVIESMGYDGILAEGADHVLGWRSPNFLYKPLGCNNIKLLLKNYKLSDDIAFRFSDRQWAEFPLNSEKYASWVHNINGSGEFIGLFMDYETFGEHQWESTGIFNFMEALPAMILKNPDFSFSTPSEAIAKFHPVATLDVPYFMSWADAERDLTAWLGNDMQHDAINAIYAIEEKVKQTADENLLRVWRRLLTSDHFYYICTKWFSDGDVHKYFNPYGTPYDAYINYMNVFSDFKMRVENELKEKPDLKAESKAAKPAAKKSTATKSSDKTKDEKALKKSTTAGKKSAKSETSKKAVVKKRSASAGKTDRV